MLLELSAGLCSTIRGDQNRGFWQQTPELSLAWTQRQPGRKVPHPLSEVWWWICDTVGLFFFQRPWTINFDTWYQRLQVSAEIFFFTTPFYNPRSAQLVCIIVFSIYTD